MHMPTVLTDGTSTGAEVILEKTCLGLLFFFFSGPLLFLFRFTVDACQGSVCLLSSTPPSGAPASPLYSWSPALGHISIETNKQTNQQKIRHQLIVFIRLPKFWINSSFYTSDTFFFFFFKMQANLAALYSMSRSARGTAISAVGLGRTDHRWGGAQPSQTHKPHQYHKHFFFPMKSLWPRGSEWWRGNIRSERRIYSAPIAIKAARQLPQRIPVSQWSWMRNEDCFNPPRAAVWEASEATQAFMLG